jgi:hypothetical protein
MTYGNNPKRRRPQKAGAEKIIGMVIFSGDLNPDPGSAAAALRQHGFEVQRMPEKFRPRLAHPKDYFFEVTIDGDASDVDTRWAEVEELVSGFGAYADSFGMREPDHVPFSDLF